MEYKSLMVHPKYHTIVKNQAHVENLTRVELVEKMIDKYVRNYNAKTIKSNQSESGTTQATNT